jgi:CRP/FNR family transcriptional regulator, nitrogen oxide reductase regulator
MSVRSSLGCEALVQSARSIVQEQFSDLAEAEAFREPEQFITALLHSSGTGIAILDTHLRFSAVNDALAAMNGIEPKRHLGKTLREVLGTASERIEPFFRHVLATGQPAGNIEITALLPTRNTLGHWIGSYFPIRDRAGKVKQVAATVVEVTQQKKSTVASSAQSRSLPAEIDLVLPDHANIDTHLGEAARRQSEQGIDMTEAKRGSLLFEGLEQWTVDSVCRAATLRRCSPGDFFCIQGEVATKLFLLTQGRVKLCGRACSGKEVLLDWMKPGEVFGLGALLSSPVQYLWSVRAVERSEALCWDKAEMARIAALSPRTFENALRMALQWAALLESRFEELSSGLVEQRLAHCALYLVERNKNGAMPELLISNEELAEMAGTNLFSVNKMLNRWERLGYIQKSRRRLVITDCENLRRISLTERSIKPQSNCAL